METNRKSLVSVVINFLDAEPYLKEAINSVLAQTYENWELLLVDDGSTDGSTETAIDYQKKYPRKIYYYEHDGHVNLGASASRNLGMDKAHGDYIAFLDADDVWLPKKLTRQVEILEENHSAGMVYGPGYWWYSWTENPDDIEKDYRQNLDKLGYNKLITSPNLLAEFTKDERLVPSATGVMLRTAVIRQVGGSEDACRSIYDDQVLYAKINLEASVYVSDECWYRYRQHPTQRCNVTYLSGEMRSIRQEYLDWLKNYIKNKEIANGQIKSIISREELKLAAGIRSEFKQHIMAVFYKISRFILPKPVRDKLWNLKLRFEHRPPIGWVRFGSLRRLTPISTEFGYDRGQCIDRYYIENFLSQYSNDIKGNVLEVAENTYTTKFGGTKVTKSDVLHIHEGYPKVTIVADITTADNIQTGTFDCIILTQTLQYITDLKAAVYTLHRILKPGGVVLLSVPGISRISQYDMERWGERWHFTSLSMRELFSQIFGDDHVDIQNYGNVLVATAFLYGLSTEELKKNELDFIDPNYELLITVRAVKKQ